MPLAVKRLQWRVCGEGVQRAAATVIWPLPETRNPAFLLVMPA